ncbi:MAG TPA: outer membrane protein assembly factor BamA, partial [Ignavibacteria bacterium]|nr:outer membrane protein assembly factor BamA [Ignavibacteria bacterium]
MRDIKKVLFLFFALIFTLHFNASAQDDGPRTYKILSINAEGNKFYDSRIIVSNSGLKVGDELMIPSEATQAAIMNLWNMKLFSDVEIVVDKKV